MPRATQPVNIDGIEFDALISEDRAFSADVPSYPTEKGFVINDTIILQPMTLDMTLFVTNSPVTWAKKFGSGKDRVGDITKKLEKLYFEKKPVTIKTSTATYKNMAITSITFSKSTDTGYGAREIPISFQEIRVAESKTTTIPESYGRGGATGTSAGTANTTISSTPATKSDSTTDGNGGSKGSIAYNLANSAGLIDYLQS